MQVMIGNLAPITLKAKVCQLDDSSLMLKLTTWAHKSEPPAMSCAPALCNYNNLTLYVKSSSYYLRNLETPS